jgi:hypothetical protein
MTASPDIHAESAHCSEAERITGVGLLTDEGELWSLPKPNRHCHLFALAAFQGNQADPCRQGFTTNTGRFVGREEAKKIVRASGQDYTVSFCGPDPALYSEDVW